MSSVGFPLPMPELIDKLRFHLRSAEQIVSALRNVYGMDITLSAFNSKGLPYFMVRKVPTKKP